MDQVDEIKQKTDIVSIIGEHVKLTKAGRNFKGLCPFHEERTPSFMVSPELQIYKCFGCGEAGDVFNFLEKYEGLEFYDALKFLADKAGVKLIPRAGQETSIKQKILDANDLAARFYHYLLLNHKLGEPGLTYLTDKRGLKKATLETFNLGFSPVNPTILFDTLTRKKGVSAEVLLEAGLVFKTRNGYMDRFRGRVIFPIVNHRNEIVALAGRLLPEFDDGKSGKYINSPETPVYHKSSSLFGLNITKDSIRSSRTAVVVEGELDLISPWQAGIKNIVAIKGTALTMEHVRLLGRFADSLIIALDSDFAGDTAAIRGMSFAQNAGLEIKVPRLGKYKDPDEFARADPDGLKQSLKNASDAWEFVINVLSKRYDLGSGVGKARASKQLVPVLAAIEDDIVRAHYIQKAAMKLKVPVEAVIQEVSKKIGKAGPSEAVSELVESHHSRRELLEEELLGLLIIEPEIAKEIDLLKLIATPLALKILSEILSYLKNHKHLEPSELSATLPSELKAGFADVVIKSSIELPKNPLKDAKMLEREISKLVLKEEIDKLTQLISREEEKGSESKMGELEERFHKLSQELTSLDSRPS